MRKLGKARLPNVRFVFSELLVSFPQFLVGSRRIQQRVDERLLLLPSELPDGVFRNGLLCGLL